MQLSMQKLIGKNYGNGWWTNCKCRYRVYKGARNTKKSYVMIGYEVLDKIISSPQRNILIIRNVSGTNRFSTFSTLEMLINQPDRDNPEIDLSKYFKFNRTDLTITYLPTGQLILFRGMNDPQRLQSIRVPHGYLTDVYVEEAFEIKDYEGWRKVDGSIRGELPNNLFFQITFCFNAWSSQHWLYEHFFKGRLEDNYNELVQKGKQEFYDPELFIDYGKGLFLSITTYKVNEFITDEYKEAMEQLKLVAPEIYKVEALGMWGNSTESTYPEMNDQLIKEQFEINTLNFSYVAIGIDTGLSDGQGNVEGRVKSATTMQMVGITQDFEKLCCIDEFFWTNENKEVPKTEPQLMTELIETLLKWQSIYPQLFLYTMNVFVDCADIGFRQGLQLEARRLGLTNVVFYPSTKIKIQSRVDFIRLIMAYGEFWISKNCKNLIRELKNSRHDNKTGKVREDIDDHAINANEYAWCSIISRMRRWKTFKQR